MTKAVSKHTIPRRRLLVGVTDAFEDDIQIARDYGIGAEIQHLSMPPYLGRVDAQLIDNTKQLIEDLTGAIGFHGYFMDTSHVSPDPSVVALCRERYIESLETANALGARYVVYHTQYNTQLRLPEYPEMFHDASLTFWPEIVQRAAGMDLTIYLENMFDTDPRPAARVAEAIDSPNFKLCLDVAHAVIHSDEPLDHWINICKPHLGHIHINDCDGTHDLHLNLGEGTLDLDYALHRLENLDLDLTYTLEIRGGCRSSLDYLGLSPL